MGGAPTESGLQVLVARLAAPEAFSLAAATNATVALWVGGGEENFSGGPPVLRGSARPRPASSKRFTEAAMQFFLRGKKQSFVAGRGRYSVRLRPERPGRGCVARTRASEPTRKLGAGPRPPDCRAGSAPHAHWGGVWRVACPEAVQDSTSGPELVQALSFRGSLEASTPLRGRRVLMRCMQASTLSPGLKLKGGAGIELHALSLNCREIQNRKSRNSEQEKPAGFKPEKEWAEPVKPNSYG